MINMELKQKTLNKRMTHNIAMPRKYHGRIRQSSILRRHYFRRGRPRKADTMKGMFKNVISMDNILMGIGVGLASTAEGYINQATGGKISGNIAKGVAGVTIPILTNAIGIGRYGRPIGKGILISTIGDLFEEHVVPMIDKTINSNGTATSSTGQTIIG